jgi:hypothetical protein
MDFLKYKQIFQNLFNLSSEDSDSIILDWEID